MCSCPSYLLQAGALALCTKQLKSHHMTWTAELSTTSESEYSCYRQQSQFKLWTWLSQSQADWGWWVDWGLDGGWSLEKKAQTSRVTYLSHWKRDYFGPQCHTLDVSMPLSPSWVSGISACHFRACWSLDELWIACNIPFYIIYSFHITINPFRERLLKLDLLYSSSTCCIVYSLLWHVAGNLLFTFFCVSTYVITSVKTILVTVTGMTVESLSNHWLLICTISWNQLKSCWTCVFTKQHFLLLCANSAYGIGKEDQKSSGLWLLSVACCGHLVATPRTGQIWTKQFTKSK